MTRAVWLLWLYMLVWLYSGCYYLDTHHRSLFFFGTYLELCIWYMQQTFWLEWRFVYWMERFILYISIEKKNTFFKECRPAVLLSLCRSLIQPNLLLLTLLVSWWRSLIKVLMLIMLGKHFSRWQFEIFFLFFSENTLWYSMQNISFGDNNLHSMLRVYFLGKIRKYHHFVICWICWEREGG